MEKPKHFFIYKIIGFAGLIMTILGVILVFSGFGNFEKNYFTIGAFIMSFGFFIAFFGLINGFKPEIAKRSIKTFNYIQEQNKTELKKMADSSVEIKKDAITKTASFIKDGIKETSFCKECGEAIDVDSKFCRHCGHKQ